MNEEKTNDDKAIEWIDSERLVEGFFTVDKILLRHAMYSGGMSSPITRFLLRRPDAVCAIVVNTDKAVMYFVNQFRIGPATKGDPAWMTELAAGVVDEGETPLQAVLREVEEELGYRAEGAEQFAMIYPSSAIISERIYCYYIEVTDDQKVSDGGGNPHEHEDLEIIEIPINGVDDFVREAQLTDAKTLYSLVWFQREKG